MFVGYVDFGAKCASSLIEHPGGARDLACEFTCRERRQMDRGLRGEFDMQVRLVAAGQTSLEELLRVTRD